MMPAKKMILANKYLQYLQSAITLKYDFNNEVGILMACGEQSYHIYISSNFLYLYSSLGWFSHNIVFSFWGHKNRPGTDNTKPIKVSFSMFLER